MMLVMSSKGKIYRRNLINVTPDCAKLLGTAKCTSTASTYSITANNFLLQLNIIHSVASQSTKNYSYIDIIFNRSRFNMSMITTTGAGSS